ncbi:hypothetical protein [Candidatus Symbiopectobacterium endolongispinus]|uniref:hypothetical protein n=1 Tax=Candidatus Symbiopectobacterium endolongispinus TaxID=2812664 RepID=UPI003F6882BE
MDKSQHDQLYQAVKKLSVAEANKATIALVDGATVDLNTLNKLAKALGNDAKFSETVINLLNQKLAKNQNGADIPDKNLFIKNLGLLEKENRWINRQTFNTLIIGNIDGNADSATRLKTARKIAGVAFDGTAHINLPGVNMAGNQSTTGNVGTATKLATARNINGVAFYGTKNIYTGLGLGLKLVAILQTSVHQLGEVLFKALDKSTLETTSSLNTRGRFIETGKTKLLLLEHIATASRFQTVGKYVVTSISSPDSFTTETIIRIHYPSHGVPTGSTKTFRLGGIDL